jgi:hypothetical protein
MAADELVLSEEAKEWWLVAREVPAQREEILEAIADNLQAGQGARRTWLECRVVAAERRVKVVNGNGERCRTVTRSTLCDIRDGRFGHESLLVVPECLFTKD